MYYQLVFMDTNLTQMLLLSSQTNRNQMNGQYKVKYKEGLTSATSCTLSFAMSLFVLGIVLLWP